MAMFIRIKRGRTTYFVHCDPSETILEIKQKVQALSDTRVDAQRLILLSTQQVLDDARTLADQKVENDAVVALTFRIPAFPALWLGAETGQWEDINIENPNEHSTQIDSD